MARKAKSCGIEQHKGKGRRKVCRDKKGRIVSISKIGKR